MTCESFSRAQWSVKKAELAYPRMSKRKFSFLNILFPKKDSIKLTWKQIFLTPKKNWCILWSNSKLRNALIFLPDRFTSNSSSTSQRWIPVPDGSRIHVGSAQSPNGTVTSTTQSRGSRGSIQIAQEVSTGPVQIHADSIDSFSDSGASGNQTSRHSVY